MVESAVSYFASLPSELPLVAWIFANFALYMFFRKRMSQPLTLASYAITSLYPAYAWSNHAAVTVLLSALLYAAIVWIKAKYYYDLVNTFYSLSKIKNKYIFGSFNKPQKGDRIIGEIKPYYEGQIRDSGKTIVSDPKTSQRAMLISGTMGSGKTYAMISMILKSLRDGKPVAFFDYKADPLTLIKLRYAANKLGIPIYEMSEFRTDFNYDPLANFKFDSKVEAIHNMRNWEGATGPMSYYKNANELVVRETLEEYEKLWPGIKEKNENATYIGGYYGFLTSYGSRRLDKLHIDGYNDLYAAVKLLLKSSLRDTWLGKNDKNFRFDQKGTYLALFAFRDSNKGLATTVANFAYKDILDTGTMQGSYKDGLTLVSDEVGKLENQKIYNALLTQGRSPAIESVFAFQDFFQISDTSTEDYRKSLIGAVGSFLLFDGSTTEQAEIVSGKTIDNTAKAIMTLQSPQKGKRVTAFYTSLTSKVRSGKKDNYVVYPYVDPMMKELDKIQKVDNPETSDSIDDDELNKYMSENGFMFSVSVPDEKPSGKIKLSGLKAGPKKQKLKLNVNSGSEYAKTQENEEEVGAINDSIELPDVAEAPDYSEFL